MSWSQLFGLGRKASARRSHDTSDIIGSTDPDAFVLGRYRDWITDDISSRLRYGDDKGVMIWGPNGTGKDTRLLIPYLLQSFGQSIVVLDVKGELAAVTAAHRRTLGPVYIINPYGVLVDQLPDLKSDGYNPLTSLDPARPSFYAECGYQAAAVKPDAENASANSKHFDDSARLAWQMFTMKEVRDAKAERRLPLMSNIRADVCRDSGYDAITKTHYGWPELARELLKSKDPALANLASQFTTWSNEKDGIASTARRSTAEFDDTEIMADMADPGFEFAELKQRPCTVYIIIPPLQLERQAGYLRLLIDNAMRAVMHNRQPGQPKCVFLLNEMFALGRLKILSTVWSLVRGYGVQIVSVWQDKSQIETVWGASETKTMIAAAGVLASFRAASMETADWLSKRCGDTTAVLSGYSEGNSQNGAGAGLSSGLNWNQVKVPAVTPHEMFGLADGYMVQFASGLDDFISAYAPPYWTIDECVARARPNPYYQPPRPTQRPSARKWWQDEDKGPPPVRPVRQSAEQPLPPPVPPAAVPQRSARKWWQVEDRGPPPVRPVRPPPPPPPRLPLPPRRG